MYIAQGQGQTNPGVIFCVQKKFSPLKHSQPVRLHIKVGCNWPRGFRGGRSLKMVDNGRATDARGCLYYMRTL